jgi:hypothetical protein
MSLEAALAVRQSVRGYTKRMPTTAEVGHCCGRRWTLPLRTASARLLLQCTGTRSKSSHCLDDQNRRDRDLSARPL